MFAPDPPSPNDGSGLAQRTDWKRRTMGNSISEGSQNAWPFRRARPHCDIRNRDELIELAELHGVEVEMTLQVAADLNHAADYEAIAIAFSEHRDVRRLRAQLEALGFAIV
jgi:hypothetical protein